MKIFASESPFYQAFCIHWKYSLLILTVTKNIVCYKDFTLKDTKLLSELP